jgi:hypothetical protein
MHIHAIPTAEAVVRPPLALTARITTFFAGWFPIPPYRIIELLGELLLEELVEYHHISTLLYTIVYIVVQSLVTGQAILNLVSTCFTLIAANCTLFERVEPVCLHGDPRRTTIVASIIVKTKPGLAVVFASHTVSGRANAGPTIWTAFHAFEVGVSQRDRVARVTCLEAGTFLEEWFLTLDIAGVAIKRAFSTTLTWCLAGLTLARDLVAVGSEGAFGLAVATVEERVRPRLVAGQTDVSVFRLAFKAVILTWLTGVGARIVVCLSWTLFPAEAIV